MQARLPQDKRDKITALLEEWSQKRWCKRKELKSLIAHLQLACMVILQGRSFLCQMMNLLCAFCSYDHLICLNQEFFLDLARKQEVFQSWNGCSFLLYPQWTLLADFEVSSDASGALGYGAVVQGHWFSGASLAKQVSQSTEYKHGEAPFPYGRGSLPQGSPYGPSNGSTSGNSAVWYFKSPLPSCPRFAVCPY